MTDPLILADSSIWIDYFRLADIEFARRLRDRLVLSHPYVVGELALGSIKNRATILEDIASLPSALVASHDDVMVLIERHELFGRGIGYVDAHLLAATLLTPGARLWTRDRRLLAVANAMNVGAP